MARYRRYRRTIVRAPKKKWCSNMQELSFNVENSTSSPASTYKTQVLAENKTEFGAPTPVIIKTGNFKLQADFYFDFSTVLSAGQMGTNGQLYIIYLPQGMQVTDYSSASAVVKNHPEWILAWRYFDVKQGPVTPSSIADGGRISMSSRLKRNLNTGDQVVAILIIGGLPASGKLTMGGMCQYWTCAN